MAGVGVIWLLVFDRDSVLYHMKISREIRQLERENESLRRKIDSTRTVIRRMDRPAYTERYAREVLKFRKKNEDLYLLDTTAYEFD